MKTVKTGTVRSKIKRGYQVVFIAGKEYNRYDSAGNRQPYRGKVMAVDVRNAKVKVEGAMIVKRHRKPVPQLNREGGIIPFSGCFQRISASQESIVRVARFNCGW